MRSLAVLSGGLDSSVALAQALKSRIPPVRALFFHYGSKHNDRELRAAQAIAHFYDVPLSVVRLDFAAWGFKSSLLAEQGEIPEGHYAAESMLSTVVPFRNGIMLSIAAGIAESHELDAILIGSHFGDHAIYPDCRVQFNTPMRDAIRYGTYRNIELLTPFAQNDKWYIAKEGARLNVPMHLTWSCYKGGEVHCGKCGTCVERKEAFTTAQIKDPTEYLA